VAREAQGDEGGQDTVLCWYFTLDKVFQGLGDFEEHKQGSGCVG
jgi:hypothetical protein